MLEKFSKAELFVIGTSAGGVDLLHKILPAFKKTSHYKVALVIHMAPEGPNLIPSLFTESNLLKVSEAIPGEVIENDHIYVSPTDYHLCIEPNKTFSLSSEEPVNFSRPSIDLLFESAAYAYGKHVVGILLSGANEDGARGLRKIQEAGGITIVQDTKEAEFSYMPLAALKIMKPDLILTSDEIASLILNLCSKGISDEWI
jgi:two-component system chemotaxis response regulator CheB